MSRRVYHIEADVTAYHLMTLIGRITGEVPSGIGQGGISTADVLLTRDQAATIRHELEWPGRYVSVTPTQHVG